LRVRPDRDFAQQRSGKPNRSRAVSGSPYAR
jgi:hypothetical protein